MDFSCLDWESDFKMESFAHHPNNRAFVEWFDFEVLNTNVYSSGLGSYRLIQFSHERRLLFAYMESSIRTYPGLSKISYLAFKTR